MLSRESALLSQFGNLQSGFAVVLRRPTEGVLPGAREKTREQAREKILSLVQRNPRINMAELAAEVGLSAKGVEWNIKALKTTGSLKRVGPDKGGHWKVVG
ncbi:MAG: winged helix-turn-helix transcriptional regulator [Planctomycetota bacterium]|nr:winged helix-turn-helix transcriptional regulator [Planctomycetota bacterium]